MTTLFVLAGGFGTRLRSMVPEVPKPLAPVAGHPFLYYLIRSWVDQGVSEFIFLLHFQHNKIITFLNTIKNNAEFSGVRFRHVIEKEPLGTGGSLLNAVSEIKICNSILVANADTWLEHGIKKLASHKPNVIGCVEVADNKRFGVLEIDTNLDITQFNEKEQNSSSGFVNAGIYHLSLDIFKKFNKGDAFSIETDIFPSLVKSRALKSLKLNCTFVDIGIPKDYKMFCNLIETGEINDF